MGKIVKYKNELVDNYYLTSKKEKFLNIFIGVIWKIQNNEKFARFETKEIYQSTKTSKIGFKEFQKMVLELKNQCVIAYKAPEDVFENGVLKRKKGDIVYEDFFESFSFDPNDTNFLTIEVKDKFKPFIFDVKENFTQHSFKEFLEMSSKYAKSGFIFASRWAPYGKEVVFPLDDVRMKFSVPKSYKWQDIKRQVLDKAKEEIEAKSDISFDYRPIKVGRSVGKVAFDLKRNYGKEILELEAEVPNEPQSRVQKEIEAAKKNIYVSRAWNKRVDNKINKIRKENGEDYAVDILKILYKNLKTDIKITLVAYINGVMKNLSNKKDKFGEIDLKAKNNVELKKDKSGVKDKNTLIVSKSKEFKKDKFGINSEEGNDKVSKLLLQIYDIKTKEEKEEIRNEAIEIYLKATNSKAFTKAQERIFKSLENAYIVEIMKEKQGV